MSTELNKQSISDDDDYDLNNEEDLNKFIIMDDVVLTELSDSPYLVLDPAISTETSDEEFNNFLNPLLFHIAEIIIKLKISANFVTLLSFLSGLVCFCYIIDSNFMLALIFFFFNRLVDGLDGAVARINGQSDLGAFYDIVSDFFFYALFPLGFIFQNIENTFSICFLFNTD